MNNSSALSLWLFKQRFKLVKPRTQSWETSLSSTGILATIQTQETTLILGSSSVPVVWSIDHRHHVGASFFKNFDFPEESQMRSPGDFYAHKSLRWSCLWDYKHPCPLGKLWRFFFQVKTTITNVPQILILYSWEDPGAQILECFFMRSLGGQVWDPVMQRIQ